MKISGDASPVIEVEPGLFGVPLVDGSCGARGVALLRGWLKPQACHSPHTHNAEEAVVFLAGTGTLRVGDQTYSVQANDAVLIPAGVVHSTQNTGDVDLTFVASFSDALVITTPAQFDSNASRSRPLDTAINKFRWFSRRILHRLKL